MSEMLGADVEQLRALAGEFSAKSEILGGVQRMIDGSVNQLPRYWQGPDAAQFAAQWRGQSRGILARAAGTLLENADQLRRNADEQEQASSVAGLGGPGGNGQHPSDGSGGGETAPYQFGPDWLADEDSPFRNGWYAYDWAKLIPNMRAGIFDLASMASEANRAGFFDPAAWKTFQSGSGFSQFANMSSDLFDGNWGSAFHLAESGNAFKFLDAGGHALGAVGVGLDVIDGVNHLANGEYGDAGYSAAKAVLGVASFAPPPVGPAAMVASGALFLYDNVPIIHDSINFVGEKIGQGVGTAVDAVADFFGF